MADQDVRVRGDVSVLNTSKERVAFDLMDRIAAFEEVKSKDRAYWIRLYCQCHMATNGYGADKILSV